MKALPAFLLPQKLVTSPFFSGELHIPAGGYALHRGEEESFGPHSVQTERERYRQRPEQRPLPGPDHLHTQHWEVGTTNSRHLG